MARSKQRKAAKEKATKERTQLQIENMNRRKEEDFLWKIAHEIGLQNPPGFRVSGETVEDVEKRFETDTTAPLVLYTLPPDDGTGAFEEDQVLVSVNSRGIERALRAKGIDENHPTWEKAFQLTQETLLEVAKQVVTHVPPGPGWRPQAFGG